ncbi:DUF5702 domain-containing protein [Eubacterium sp. CAG:156]|uniref:DUF5702 domain-containing protein n=1 Tax=Eubacterium sp. CAG:156 TaxID=1262880 RepID=UPI000336537A|nr:conserved domain protein [Eubacterium sp. CAG:156]
MRLKASVTIFLSLVITVVIVVVCTVIESARISVSQMEGKAATYMAVESVFAGYGKQLYQDYGILLAWEQEPLGNQVTRYMQDNINMADLDFKKYDFSNIEIESVNILKQKYATDKEGDLFVKQVVDYAKYIVGIDAVNKLISDSEEENNNKETCNEIKENSNVTNIANDVSKEMIGIVEKINTQIDELKKTEKLKGKMSAVFQKFDDLKANITANITGQNQNQNIHNKKVKKFWNKYKKLKSVLKIEDTLISKTLTDMDTYVEKKNAIEKEMNGDFSGYEDYIESDRESLKVIKESIEEILTASNVDADINQSNISEIEKMLDKVKSIEKSLWNLKKGNSNDDAKEEKNLYERAKSLISDGVLGIVLEDVNNISTMQIRNLNLPTTLETDGNKKADLIKDITNKGIFVKYIELYFNNYAKISEYGNDDTALKYEMEYILNGNLNDKDNLTETIKKLVEVRNLSNGAYLITDGEKMKEITTLAETVATAIGMPFLTPVAQAVIIEAWALTEAVIDVRQLLNGEKVPIVKNSENWNSSIKNIGTFEDGRKNNTGLTYTQYLQTMIMTQKTKNTVFRTMDLVQVNMQKRYNKDFLISECFGMCEVEANLRIEPVFTSLPIVSYLIGNNNESYIYKTKMEYEY